MSLTTSTRTARVLSRRAECAKRHVLLGRDPVADRAGTPAEELPPDRVERGDRALVDPELVARPDPAVGVGVEEDAARLRRAVVAPCMPEPPVEYDRRAGAGEKRRRGGGLGVSRQRVPRVAPRNDAQR